MAKKEINHESTSLQQLRDKIGWLTTSVQLAIAALKMCNRYTKHAKDQEQMLYENFELDPTIYDKLNQPVKQYEPLEILVQHKQVHAALGQLYEFFSNYLHDIVDEIKKYKPENMLHLLTKKQLKEFSLALPQIQALGSVERIQNAVLEQYFCKLHQTQHTQDLFKKLITHTRITIDSHISWRCLGFLTLRNLLVHNKGILDASFVRDYKGVIEGPIMKKIITNKEVPLDIEVFQQACSAIFALCKEMDTQLISKDLIKSRLSKR